MMGKKCEDCKHWVQGDQVLSTDIGNVGNCVFLTTQGSGFYEYPQHTPYWARELIHRTTSFNGTNCPVHELQQALEKDDG